MTDADGTAPPTVNELVTAYLENQDLEHLARLRSAVAGSPSFDPDLNLVAEVGPLVEQGRHQEVVDAVTARMPGAALNPTAHMALSMALEGLGREDAAKRESLMVKVAVSSVLSTGDGTEASPWSVLRVADEYDVMRAQEITPRGQSSLTVDGRLVDRHETADGGEVWFVLDRPRAPVP